MDMECAQAQAACAVRHDATDGSAASAQQVEDGDSGGRLPAIDQVALAFMENMKVRSFSCSTADVFKVPIVLGKPTNVSNM
jgi:hypothetical protein